MRSIFAEFGVLSIGSLYFPDLPGNTACPTPLAVTLCAVFGVVFGWTFVLFPDLIPAWLWARAQGLLATRGGGNSY